MDHSNLEYGVEYYPNPNEGEQFEYLEEWQFIDLINLHKSRGYAPMIEYERFTIYDNGRSGRRLTIKDEYGLFYG